MDFWGRVIEELEYSGKNKSDLARYLGVNTSTTSTWIARKTIPAADIALNIAQYLDTTVEYLVTGDTSQPVAKTFVNQDVAKFYDAYCKLDERDKQTLEEFMEMLLKHYSKSETKSS